MGRLPLKRRTFRLHYFTMSREWHAPLLLSLSCWLGLSSLGPYGPLRYRGDRLILGSWLGFWRWWPAACPAKHILQCKLFGFYKIPAAGLHPAIPAQAGGG